MCFVTPSERAKWNAINRLLDPEAKPEPMERKARPEGGYKGKNAKTGRPPFRGNKKPQGAHAAGGKPEHRGERKKPQGKPEFRAAS
jgi:hypothetical protein